MTFLDKLTPGQSAKVVGYTEDSSISRRLMELGLVPGREVIYLRNAPLQDPLQVQVGRISLSLRHAEASLVAVETDK